MRKLSKMSQIAVRGILPYLILNRRMHTRRQLTSLTCAFCVFVGHDQSDSSLALVKKANVSTRQAAKRVSEKLTELCNMTGDKKRMIDDHSATGHASMSNATRKEYLKRTLICSSISPFY